MATFDDVMVNDDVMHDDAMVMHDDVMVNDDVMVMHDDAMGTCNAVMVVCDNIACSNRRLDRDDASKLVILSSS